MLIDCHVHSVGRESINEVVDSMTQAGIDKAVVFAPYPDRSIIALSRLSYHASLESYSCAFFWLMADRCILV